jgi:DNA-binding transcriptional LysR family regulator
LAHVWIEHTEPDPGKIDITLDAHGLSRNIMVRVPSFLLAVRMVATTELLSILPRKIVEPFVNQGLVSIIPLPFDFPVFHCYQYWHERYHNDPQHVWFRKLVVDIAKKGKGFNGYPSR